MRNTRSNSKAMPQRVLRRSSIAQAVRQTLHTPHRPWPSVAGLAAAGLLALSTPGSIWTIASPILMTFLLLKVSGVSLLEKDIHERRPAYRRYKETTPAFFPWKPRRAETRVHLGEGQP